MKKKKSNQSPFWSALVGGIGTKAGLLIGGILITACLAYFNGCQKPDEKGAREVIKGRG